MTLLALPGTAVLIQRIPRLHTLETSGADKYPAARLVDADAIEDLLGSLTTIACFDANPFDGQLNHPFWLGHRNRPTSNPRLATCFVLRPEVRALHSRNEDAFNSRRIKWITWPGVKPN